MNQGIGQSLVDGLMKLGLTDKEAAVYAAVLKMKKGTALSVAEAAGIKRPTVYSVLESLHTKRLVRPSRFRDVLDFHVEPVENLKQYVDTQKEALLHELPHVQRLYNNRQFKVRLRVYHDIEHAKVLFEKSLREKSRITIVGNENWFKETFGDYWNFYTKRAGATIGLPVFKYHVGSAALLLWSDKIAFISQTDEPQIVAFKNKELNELYGKAARKL